jgi:hypothetical protein
MTEITDHLKIDQNQQFKYVLRLMSLAEAKEFEHHLTNCDLCAKSISEVTQFFELLQNSISTSSPSSTEQQIKNTIIENQLGGSPDQSSTIQSMLQNPASYQLNDLLSILVSCFNGFQKLRKNIATQLNSQIETAQIEQVALEILLALPKQVSKI